MLIKLAGVPIELDALHEATNKLCREYEIEGAEVPAFRVYVDKKDIEDERFFTAEYERSIGEEPRNYSDADLEPVAVHRKVCEHFADMDRLMFHGSAIAVNGKAYILAAKSGTGKSTLARNIAAVLGDGMMYINDDKPFLEVVGSGADGKREVKVYGSPWDGKHRLSNNICMPLEAVLFIERADEPWIKKVEARNVLAEFCQQAYIPRNGVGTIKVMDLLDYIGRNIQLYKLGTTLDDRTARLIVEQLLAEGMTV